MGRLTPPAAPVAFFDVDETLVAMKSPFALLRYRLREQGDRDGSAYRAKADPIRRFAAQGGAPAEASAMFYRALAGVPWSELLRQGRDWYRELHGRGVPFVEATLRALRHHQSRGHLTVAVSGAWPASLRPLADDLGFDQVLCTQPEVDRAGLLTGRIERAMFGPAKGAAVRAVLAAQGAAAGECFAYADDPSDLDMLRLVGRPAVVGDHPVLAGMAAEHGWQVLSGALVPGAERIPV
ncbi:HAD family hydrolase [Streptomyces sp. NPDC016845]|uniref:HAD family hydrolase n=1 Tax=Streptomyces sp. NPDC016845 TaxID=3364972 RepID=UPI0037912F95